MQSLQSPSVPRCSPKRQVVSFCESNEVGPPLSEDKNAADEVFSNTLIWKIIGSYLNVGDLKACRLVNSEFHGMIMKETNFLQRCVVSLKPYQITRNNFGSTSELWKNVLLKLQSPGEGSYCSFSEVDVENLDWLYPVISNVESLSLRMKKGTKGGNLFHLLKRLLLAPKKLRSLAMEPIFLVRGTTAKFEELKELLGNLEEFEILQPSTIWLTEMDCFGAIDPWLVSADFIQKLENLQVVKSYHPVVSALPEPGLAFMVILLEFQILNSVLARIALRSSKTLKHVTLGELSLLGHQEGFSPSLRNVSKKSQPDAVTKFFEAMPMVQELDFLSLSLNKRSLSMEILNVMKGGSDRLRKVKLRSSCFDGTKWEFLEKTKLEEFQLELLDSGYRSTLPSEAQNYLPSTIRRLFLRGPLESNPVPALRRLNPALVTQLTFIDSGDCFGDDAIQYILENFVMLRKLNVTNAKRVTDAGFIGSSSGSGSLSGIKGLRTLILRECGSIKDATLKEIRFLELCHLDLAYNENLTEGGLEGVLSNNSSLETLLTPCKNVHRKREQLCASHPRLSSIIYRGSNQ